MPFGQGAKLLELLDDRTRLEREVGQVKGRLAQVNAAIIEVMGGALANAYLREGKPDGTVKFAIDNHIFKAVVDKRVEWDNDALVDIAFAMDPLRWPDLFTVKFVVPEAKFKAVLDPTLKAKLTVARTVKYSDPKITLAEPV